MIDRLIAVAEGRRVEPTRFPRPTTTGVFSDTDHYYHTARITHHEPTTIRAMQYS